MKLIRNFEINSSSLPASGAVRNFKVEGDDGAVFSLQVKTSAGRTYNFSTKVFDTTETSACRLTNQVLVGKVFSGSLTFPADADGETYTVMLYAEPHYDTKIEDGLIGEKDDIPLQYNPVLLQREIKGLANVTVTINPISAVTANYTTTTMNLEETSSKSPSAIDKPVININWSIDNKADTSNGFGFETIETTRRVSSASDKGLSVEVEDDSWYTSTTFVIDDEGRDASTSHYNYKVDDITGLTVGMTVTGVSAGSLSGTPTLTRVAKYKGTVIPSNRGKQFVKFSVAQSLADGTTVTVKGYGANAIEKATGCKLKLEDFKIVQNPLTTTVRGDISSSQTINVNGTLGIGKTTGGTYIEGFGVNNHGSNNPLTGVSIHATQGNIVSTVAQTLLSGTVLNIVGCSNSYTLTGKITIEKFPTSNKIIYLDLDKILRVGTAS